MKINIKIWFLFIFPLISGFNSQGDKIISQAFEVGSVNSIIVEIKGERIAGSFSGGMNASRATNMKSASKSILSLLIGIAIDEGYLKSVDQPIGEFFPGYFSENPDSAKEAITLKDLITMRSGLETTSFRNYGRWVTSPNWTDFVLDQRLEHEPGGRMIYSTGTSHLLSVILTRASGISTRQFANRYLFGPMNIQIGGWDRDPQGYYMGGNNLAMSPDDMAKIGNLMLNMGNYNGRQIVSPRWIEESVTIYTRSNFNPYDYGYMWWRRVTAGFDVVFAWGHGGQYIIIIPELDAVISITSDLSRNEGRAYQRQLFQYLESSLIPYLKNYS